MQGTSDLSEVVILTSFLFPAGYKIISWQVF